MLRTLSSLFLAGVMIAGGTLAATADMVPASSGVTVMTPSTPMTATQTASIKTEGARVAPTKAAPLKAMTRTAKNKQIRAWGGIPPCKWEDGSGQVLPCYWNAKLGDGNGDSFIAVSNGKGNDPKYIYLTGPKAKRY